MHWDRKGLEPKYYSYNKNQLDTLIYSNFIFGYSEKKTPDDGQRNSPKHVEFYSKNKI